MALVDTDGTTTTLTRTTGQGILLQNGTDRTLLATVTGGVQNNFSGNMEPGAVVYLNGIASNTDNAVVTAEPPHGTGLPVTGEFRATAGTD